MANGNLETRISALEVQMQEMRDLLQQTIRLQSQTSADIAALTQAQERTQRQLDITLNIANSNARSIEAWESRIEENQIEAEEERSELRVNLNNVSQNLDRLQGNVDELVRLARQNEVEHQLFWRRFETIDPLTDAPEQ